MLQYLLNGLALGGIYGLIAVAFTMIYGVIGLVNFAFGEIFMFGAFGAVIVTLHSTILFGKEVRMPGWPLPIGILVGLLVGGSLGLIVERIAYRPLRSAPMLSLLITSLGVSLFLRSFGQTMFGAGEEPYPQLVGGPPITIGGAEIQRSDLAILIIAFCTMIVLALIVQRTAVGRAMRP